MSVLAQGNFLGQQRLDVPHLRLQDASVSGDFDALAAMITGENPRILQGFSIVGTTGPAATLALRVAGGRCLHPTASDAGSIYVVPADEADEVLSPSNAHVEGAFVPGQANFIGLDLVRQADDRTRDVVMFLGAATLTDAGRSVPLLRTLTRRIVITTMDPDSTPGLASIAKVVTDSANNVVTVTDVRARLFRLGTGGGAPDPLHAYAWPLGRGDGATFAEAGDKQLGDLKAWIDATATRLWELGGGERWYAPTADRNVVLTGLGSTFGGTGEYFEWDGSNVHWRNLAVSFDNSTGRINEIADQLTDSVGLTNLADGECLYVDLDRTQNLTGGGALLAAKATLTALGQADVPGGRWAIAWRRGAQVYYRGKLGPIGATSVPTATPTVLGSVLLSGTAPVPAAPVAGTLNATSRLMAAGLTRSGARDGSGGGGLIGNGLIAIGPDATTDTGVTYGNTSMSGGHIFDAAPAGGDLLLVRNATDSNVTPGTKSLRVRQTHSATLKDVFYVDGAGGVVRPIAFYTPPIPAAGYTVEFYRLNGLSSPDSRVQKCVRFDTGQILVVAESDAS